MSFGGNGLILVLPSSLITDDDWSEIVFCWDIVNKVRLAGTGPGDGDDEDRRLEG